MQEDTAQKKYLKLATSTLRFANNNILEIGGCTHPGLLLQYAPSKWTSVNLDTEAVSNFNNYAREFSLANYTAIFQDISNIDENVKYDLLYSINCFEHISNLKLAISKMFAILRPNGYLFTIFGPIWSSDVGHHLSIPTDKGPLNFSDGILEPWEHLSSSPEAIRSKLVNLYNSEIADRAIDYIFTYHDLNRLYESDYLNIIMNSGFIPVIILRNKKGKPPNIKGATNTREFLMILKKGHVSSTEKISCFIKLSWTLLRFSLR